MSKRTLSGNRLYKLAKILVLIISVLTFLISIPGYWAFDTTKATNFVNYTCKNIPFAAFCPLGAWQTIDTIKNSTFLYTSIAILLPLIFFGSTWIYKYLFPTKVDEK